MSSAEIPWLGLGNIEIADNNKSPFEIGVSLTVFTGKAWILAHMYKSVLSSPQSDGGAQKHW